jgi:hypothetical protein
LEDVGGGFDAVETGIIMTQAMRALKRPTAAPPSPPAQPPQPANRRMGVQATMRPTSGTSTPQRQAAQATHRSVDVELKPRTSEEFTTPAVVAAAPPPVAAPPPPPPPVVVVPAVAPVPSPMTQVGPRRTHPRLLITQLPVWKRCAQTAAHAGPTRYATTFWSGLRTVSGFRSGVSIESQGGAQRTLAASLPVASSFPPPP